MENALEDIEYIEDYLAKLTKPYTDDLAALNAAVDKYMLAHYKPKQGIETPRMNLTIVQSHKRQWDAAILERLVPRAVFKNLVEVTVIPAKIDEYVRAKKIDRKKIEKAYVETPNKPYVKRSKKKANTDERAEQQADSLAGNLE